MNRWLQIAANEYAGRVNIVIRHSPRSSHPRAVAAATAAEAAANQGRFSEMSTFLFENQLIWSDSLEDPTSLYIDYALALGLDGERFVNDLKADPVASRIDLDAADAIRFGVNRVPALFLDGEALPVDSSSYTTLSIPLDALVNYRSAEN